MKCPSTYPVEKNPMQDSGSNVSSGGLIGLEQGNGGIEPKIEGGVLQNKRVYDGRFRELG